MALLNVIAGHIKFAFNEYLKNKIQPPELISTVEEGVKNFLK